MLATLFKTKLYKHFTTFFFVAKKFHAKSTMWYNDLHYLNICWDLVQFAQCLLKKYPVECPMTILWLQLLPQVVFMLWKSFKKTKTIYVCHNEKFLGYQEGEITYSTFFSGDQTFLLLIAVIQEHNAFRQFIRLSNYKSFLKSFLCFGIKKCNNRVIFRKKVRMH